MSAIASFVLVPTASLATLRAAVLDGRPLSECLESFGGDVAEYPWSGYIMMTLLPYLAQKYGIDLVGTDELATEMLGVGQDDSVFCTVLTVTHKGKYLEKLDPSLFSKDALRDVYNEFNESDESDAGEPMLAGIRCLREALEHVNDDSIVVLTVG